MVSSLVTLYQCGFGIRFTAGDRTTDVMQISQSHEPTTLKTFNMVASRGILRL